LEPASAGEPGGEMSLQRIRNLDRRVERIAAVWRRLLVRYLTVLGELLPQAFAPPSMASVLRKLHDEPTLAARRRVVREEARHKSRAEVNQTWRSRFRRRAARSGAKLNEAVRDALRSNGVTVTGREMLQDGLGSKHEAERAPILQEYLVHPVIDVGAGTLQEGGHRWCKVVIGLDTDMPPRFTTHRPKRPGSPALWQRLAQWLRTDGSRYRDSSDRVIKRAFKADTGLAVGKETIRLARKDLRLKPRKKGPRL
jgi:hypothetical protein